MFLSVHGRAIRLIRVAILLGATFVLGSCGGGGGGGGGGGTRGEFILSGNSLSFTGRSLGPGPQSQSLALTLQDSGTSFVGAAYPPGVFPPGWLDVAVAGSAPNYSVVFTAGSGFGPGTFNVTVLVGTADEDGNVLKSQSVTVSLTLTESLRAAPAADNSSLVFGSVPVPDVTAVNVTAADGTTWRATSNVPWLSGPAGTFTGDQSVDVVADLAALAPGGNLGEVRFTSTADPTEFTTFTYSASVLNPTVNVFPTVVELGGIKGFGPSASRVQVSLDTDSASYPWTAEVTTAIGTPWLSASPASGVVGTSPQDFKLAVDRNGLATGNYSAQIRVRATVRGRIFETLVPVTAVIESEQLYVDRNGVALSSFPSRQLLSRTLPVKTTRGRTGVPWTAQSSQPWLSVTSSGQTGGNLLITADPAGLAADTVHLATVTLSASSPGVSGGETIRVALWKGSADPVNLEVLSGPVFGLVTNPVEPWVYWTGQNGSIRVHNVYTGALVTTFANVSPEVLGALRISSDGRELFAVAQNPWQVLRLDATSGATLGTYTFPGIFYQGNGRTGLAYTRTRGRPILWTPFGVRDVASGLDVPFLVYPSFPGALNLGEFRALPPDGSRLVSMDLNVSPQTLYSAAVDYTAVGGGSLLVDGQTQLRNIGGQDVCVRNDSTRTYGAGDAGGIIRDAVTLAPLGTHGGAFGIACGWNDKIYAFYPAAGSDPNLQVYAADGSLLGETRTLPLNYGLAFDRLLQLSGDLFRAVSVSYGADIRLGFTTTPVDP